MLGTRFGFEAVLSMYLGVTMRTSWPRGRIPDSW